jgi:DNA end-binding protein Ku
LPEHTDVGLRPLWSGTLTFGLVTIPVELYAARRREGIAFRMLAPDGAPLAREYYCPEDGEAIEGDDIVRGYPLDEKKMVTITDEELRSLAPRRSRDIELQQFVDRAAIDPMYFRRAYFLLPAGDSTKAYRLLADTLERTKRAGIARFVMRDKEYLVAITADNGIMRSELLRFGDELRPPVESEEEPDREVGHRLEQAMKKLSHDKLDEKRLADAEAKKIISLAERKRAQGKDVVEVPEELRAAESGDAEEGEAEEEGGEVLDLMRVLKERMGKKR